MLHLMPQLLCWEATEALATLVDKRGCLVAQYSDFFFEVVKSSFAGDGIYIFIFELYL